MSIYRINVPSPDEHDFHEAQQVQQVQRVQAAMKLIDPGDVLAVIDSRIAAEADPTAHPLYGLVCWVLDKHVAPLDGGQLFDRWHQLVMAAVDTCLDDALEAMEG